MDNSPGGKCMKAGRAVGAVSTLDRCLCYVVMSCTTVSAAKRQPNFPKPAFVPARMCTEGTFHHITKFFLRFFPSEAVQGTPAQRFLVEWKVNECSCTTSFFLFLQYCFLFLFVHLFPPGTVSQFSFVIMLMFFCVPFLSFLLQ